MSFTFKLDPASLPKLSSRGENYAEWRSAWTLALKYAGLWPTVSKATIAVTDDDYEEKDTRALVMLLSSVHTDLTMTVTTCESSNKAWVYLRERFDRDTGNVAIHSFRALTNLRYHDGEDLKHHLDNFHQVWTKMARKTQGSTQPVAKAMKPIFESDEVKGSFFLTTLPDTMDNLIDNLATRGITTFVDIEPKILDIAEKHSLDTVDSSAYYTTTRKLKNTNTTTPNNECTWCKKHDMTFIGHVYTNCRKLKKYQEENKKEDNPQTASKKKQKGDNMANAVALDSDNESATVNAFNTVVENGKRIREESAYTTSPLPLTSGWILDSGASRHMSGSIDDFSSVQPRSGTITVAGDLRLPIEGVGTVRLRCRLPDGSTVISELTNVLYSRELKSTKLFSWPYVRHKGYTMEGKGDDMYLLGTNGHTVWARYLRGAMQIQLDETLNGHSSSTPLTTASACFSSYMEFHTSMGHASITNPTRVYKDGEVIPEKPKDFHCSTCHLSKSTHTRPKPISSSRSSAPFELIHSDLSGKFSTKSIGGSRYFVTFIDDYTRFTWIRFIPLKSDTSTTIHNFLKYVKTQFNATVKRFRSDNGGEYMATACHDILKEHGIEWESTTPYNHESNGVAERFNRTVVTAARAMIEDDNHLFLWPEAVHTAAFLRNITSHTSLPNHITPYEALFNKKPSVKHLHPFGQGMYVHIPAEARKAGTKLLHRAERGIMVGYGKSSKIYRAYIPDRHVIVESQDVTFEPFTYNVKYDTEIDMDNPSIIKDSSGSNTPPVAPTPITPLRKAISMDTLSSSPSRIPLQQQTLIPTGTDLAPTNTTPTDIEKRLLQGDLAEPPPTVARRSTRPPASGSSTAKPTTTRAGRVTKPSMKASGLASHSSIEDDIDTEDDIYAFSVQTSGIPSTIKQAKASPDWQSLGRGY